jgi:hypothetical protein
VKIRGRFIGILAVLGLLIALVPLATAGAVAGEVKLTGGEKGQYFSDQTDENIVTIEIRDADLTPLRRGTARLIDGNDQTALNLANFVVEGEKEVTERFDGGLSNPLCDHDNDGAEASPTPFNRGSHDNRAMVAACDLGDAIALDDNGDALAGTDPDADIDSYRFNLEGVARDRLEMGVIGPNDIISVVVNGRTALDTDDGSAPWYTVVEGGADVSGGGIIAVVLHDVVPQNADNSVAITFKDTEFEFSASTPLELEETRVRYGGADSESFADVNIQVTVDLTSGSTVTVASAVSGHTIVSFAYDVKEEFTAEKSMVTLNSASAGDVRLAINETSANSDTFVAKVAVFSQADYSKIVTESKNVANDDNDATTVGDDGVVNVDELNNTDGLSATGVVGVRSLARRVNDAATAIYGSDADLATIKASDFVALIIPARHDDIINVTYQDANPATSVSKSARVDLEAPVVTLVGPVDGFFTSIATVTMSAEVTDTGAGVDQSGIELKISAGTTGLSRGAAVESPIVDGYRVTAASQGTIAEGKKEWFVGVVDKVGNVPASDIKYVCSDATPPVCTGTEDNEAPMGAAAPSIGAADNPFKFTVDTRAPSLVGGMTGVSLKNPGVTSGTSKETENIVNQSTWVRVTFDTGEGGAPLDASTVEANDFRVNDAAPLDAKINAVTHMDGTTTIAKGTAVYLQVGQLDSDARPEVELTGEVKDRAGNTRTEGRIANANDGLAPSLTVTLAADIVKDEMMITVSSTENLRTNPMVQLTETKPVKDVAIATPRELSVSLQSGGLTTWTATFKNTAGQASKQYVTVTGSDAAANTAMKGFAANESDVVSFQVDSAKPMLRFVDASGKDLKTTKQEEGAVWIVAEFDEDEHAGDSFRKVSVTAVKLAVKDGEEVITEDVSQVFASEVACVDQDTDSSRYDSDDPAMNNKCAVRTLAINLTPGMYNIAVTGVDSIGNEVKGNTDFEVIAAKPFELTLRPGQNFIAIPGMPMDDGGNLDMLFSDEAISSVSTYDRSRELAGMNPWLRSSKDLETGMFSGDITAIEPGKAYFINSTASVTLEITLQAAGDLPPTIPVRQGYNAIGFWSVSGDTEAEIDLYLGSIGWSVAYSYDPTPGKGWEVLRKGGTDENFEGLKIEAGKGYLVYALYDAVLTP